ncbi:MAG: molecular chaperone TorD [Aromatoleum sp.]|jgi:TorA-specific chaperone|uniref:molecular chaperone TorD n=1 Tax=Aromatoleum sp. TaxID=2307007 RepID=UPI0028943849|nr:molecular chaperone TorD [Aromatoleum sp.]MDT3672525.1 molecular chaperone TorD [Aromatoleum sp.]
MSEADGPEVGREATGAALDIADWQLACRQRALVYGWLSTLYAAEVPSKTLSAYFAGDAAPLLDGLAALGLDTEVRRLRAALATLAEAQYPALELAADFAQLFLLDNKTGASPYASVYDGEDPRFCGAAEARMRAFLAGSALAIRDEFKEPADHLAIHLAIVARLAEQHGDADDVGAAASDAAAFLRDALLVWLPGFASRCDGAKPQFDFYPALAALTLAFVRQDEFFLCDAAGGGDLSASTARQKRGGA